MLELLASFSPDLRKKMNLPRYPHHQPKIANRIIADQIIVADKNRIVAVDDNNDNTNNYTQHRIKDGIRDDTYQLLLFVFFLEFVLPHHQ